MATTSPLSTPSPSSGSRSSVSAGSALVGAGAGGGGAGAVGAGAVAAALGAGAASAGAGSAPSPSASTVRMTWPTAARSPLPTSIEAMVPLTDDGTSMTALSVSSSINGFVLGEHLSLGDQDVEHFAGFDVLAQIGKSEFNGHIDQLVAGLGLSGSISRSFIACITTATSMAPSSASALRVPRTM